MLSLSLLLVFVKKKKERIDKGILIMFVGQPNLLAVNKKLMLDEELKTFVISISIY